MQRNKYAHNADIRNLLLALQGEENLGKTKRVGFTIPERVVEILEKVTDERAKSRFVTEAIVEKVEKERQRKLSRSLLHDYAASGEKDAKMAEEWFMLDEEAYSNYAAKDKQTAEKR
ncbi:MAG: hypothetical protein ACE5FU_08950 [Nitrospinota bacterium]